MHMRYTIHVKDLYSERVIEWSGTAQSDTHARQRASAVAVQEFGNAGTIMGAPILGIASEESQGDVRDVYEPNEEVPAILTPREKRLQIAVAHIVNNIAANKEPAVEPEVKEVGVKIQRTKAVKVL